MDKNRELSESMENYLETIFDLERENKVARAKDIASRLDVQRGSVTGALKGLEEKGLINYEPYSFVTLTHKGKKIAQEIAKRHAILKEFLLSVLQIDAEIAENTACRMEHVIDKNTLERLVCFIEFIHACPRAGEKWIRSFLDYCPSKKPDPNKCEECIEELKAD